MIKPPDLRGVKRGSRWRLEISMIAVPSQSATHIAATDGLTHTKGTPSSVNTIATQSPLAGFGMISSCIPHCIGERCPVFACLSCAQSWETRVQT